MFGIVDVGGGLRGIFGAGIFDYCLDKGIQFDYCIGVSAGSANIASYLGNQRGRNYQFYMEYTFRKEYMSLHNFLHRGSYIDLDYGYGTLSNRDGENPLDYEAIQCSESVMKVVALNALTGETVYFDKSDLVQDDYAILKASSCLPVVCRPTSVKGNPCYDGGIADPVPVQKALDDGCDRVVVILTRPRDFVRVPEKDARFARLLKRRYPKAAERLACRYSTYNDEVKLAKEYEKQGRVLILAPDGCCGMKTLTKDKAGMQEMYEQGYAKASEIGLFLA